jgi:hypothetical protein
MMSDHYRPNTRRQTVKDYPCDTCNGVTRNIRIRWHNGDSVRLCDGCVRTFRMTGDL